MSASYDMNYIPNPENDKVWFNLGKKFSVIDDKHVCASYITTRNYGKSHKMSNRIWNISFTSLKSILDDMVCGSYPPTIHKITVDSFDVALTHVFYAFPNPDIVRENHYAHRQHVYKKSYSKEDKEFIEDFLIKIRCFLIEIDTIEIIRQNKYYTKLKKCINKLVKVLDSFDELFRQAEIET